MISSILYNNIVSQSSLSFTLENSAVNFTSNLLKPWLLAGKYAIFNALQERSFIMDIHHFPQWLPSFIPVGIPVFLIIYYLRLRNQTRFQKIIKSIFILYLLVVIELTLAPFPMSQEAILHIETQHSFRYNIYLFNSLQTQEFLLNIIFFIPLGLLLPLVRPELTMKDTVFLGMVTSLTIELFQLFTSLLKLNVRAFDVDDILANTLGALIGWCLYAILSKIYNNYKKS